MADTDINNVTLEDQPIAPVEPTPDLTGIEPDITPEDLVPIEPAQAEIPAPAPTTEELGTLPEVTDISIAPPVDTEPQDFSKEIASFAEPVSNDNFDSFATQLTELNKTGVAQKIFSSFSQALKQDDLRGKYKRAYEYLPFSDAMKDLNKYTDMYVNSVETGDIGEFTKGFLGSTSNALRVFVQLAGGVDQKQAEEIAMAVQAKNMIGEITDKEQAKEALELNDYYTAKLQQGEKIAPEGQKPAIKVVVNTVGGRGIGVKFGMNIAEAENYLDILENNEDKNPTSPVLRVFSVSAGNAMPFVTVGNIVVDDEKDPEQVAKRGALINRINEVISRDYKYADLSGTVAGSLAGFAGGGKLFTSMLGKTVNVGGKLVKIPNALSTAANYTFYSAGQELKSPLPLSFEQRLMDIAESTLELGLSEKLGNSVEDLSRVSAVNSGAGKYLAGLNPKIGFVTQQSAKTIGSTLGEFVSNQIDRVYAGQDPIAGAGEDFATAFGAGLGMTLIQTTSPAYNQYVQERYYKEVKAKVRETVLNTFQDIRNRTDLTFKQKDAMINNFIKSAPTIEVRDYLSALNTRAAVDPKVAPETAKAADEAVEKFEDPGLAAMIRKENGTPVPVEEAPKTEAPQPTEAGIPDVIALASQIAQDASDVFSTTDVKTFEIDVTPENQAAIALLEKDNKISYSLTPGKKTFRIKGIVSDTGKFLGDEKQKGKLLGVSRKQSLLDELDASLELSEEQKSDYAAEIEDAISDKNSTLDQKLDSIASRAGLSGVQTNAERASEIERITQANEQIKIADEMRKLDEQLPVLEDQASVAPVLQQPEILARIEQVKNRKADLQNQSAALEGQAFDNLLRDVEDMSEPTDEELLYAKAKNKEDVVFDIYDPETEAGQKWLKAKQTGPSAKEQEISRLGENLDLSNEGVANMLKRMGALDAAVDPLMSFAQVLAKFKENYLRYYTNPDKIGYQTFSPERILDAVIDEARMISRTSNDTIPLDNLLKRRTSDFMRQAAILKKANFGLGAALSLDQPATYKIEAQNAGVLTDTKSALDMAAESSEIVLGGQVRTREQVETMSQAISSAVVEVQKEAKANLDKAKANLDSAKANSAEALKKISKEKTKEGKDKAKAEARAADTAEYTAKEELQKAEISNAFAQSWSDNSKTDAVKIKELAKRFGFTTEVAATRLQSVTEAIQSKALDIQQDLMIEGKYKDINDNIIMSPLAEITKDQLHGLLKKFLYMKTFNYFQPAFVDPETGEAVKDELDIYEPLVLKLNNLQTKSLYENLNAQFDDMMDALATKAAMDPYPKRFRDNLTNFSVETDVPRKFTLPKGKTDFYLAKLDDWEKEYKNAFKIKNDKTRTDKLKKLREDIVSLDRQYSLDIGGTYDKYGRIVLKGLEQSEPRPDLSTPEGRAKSGVNAIERAQSALLGRTAGVQTKKSRPIKNSREYVAEPDGSTNEERKRSSRERGFGERIPKQFEVLKEQQALDYSKNYSTFQKILGPDILANLRTDQFEDTVAAVTTMNTTKQGATYIANGAGLGKSRVVLATANYFTKTLPDWKVIILTDVAAIDPDYQNNSVGGTLGSDAEVMGIPLQLRGRADGLPIESLPGQIMVTTMDRSYLKQLKNIVDDKTILLVDEFQTARGWYKKMREVGADKQKQEKAKDTKLSLILEDLMKRSGKVMMLSGTPYETPDQMLPMLMALGVVQDVKDAQQLFLRFGYELRYEKDRGYREKTWGRVRPDTEALFTKEGAPRFPKTKIKQLEASRENFKNKNDWENVIKIDKLLGVTLEDMQDRIEGFQGELASIGLFRSRFMRLDNVPITRTQVELDDKIQKELKAVEKLHFGLQYTDSDIGDRINQAARFLLEQYKIPQAVKLALEARKRGEKVILFVDSVENTDKIIPGTMMASTANLLQLALEDEFKKQNKKGTEQLKIATLYGGTDRTAALQSFQGQESDIIITTINSAGVGINLDDVTGKNPRHVIFMSPPYSSISLVQAMYRVWRYNTASIPKITIFETDTSADQNTISRLVEKLSFLGASVNFGIDRNLGKTPAVKEEAPQEAPVEEKVDPAMAMAQSWIKEVREAKGTKKIADLLSLFRGKANSLSAVERAASEIFQNELTKPAPAVQAKPTEKTYLESLPIPDSYWSLAPASKEREDIVTMYDVAFDLLQELNDPAGRTNEEITEIKNWVKKNIPGYYEYHSKSQKPENIAKAQEYLNKVYRYVPEKTKAETEAVPALVEAKKPSRKVALGQTEEVVKRGVLPFSDAKSFSEWLSTFNDYSTVKAAMDDIPMPALLKQLAMVDPALDISKEKIKALSRWDALSEEEKKLESNIQKFLNPGMPFSKAPERDRRATLYTRIRPIFDKVEKKQPKVNSLDPKKVKDPHIYDHRPSEGTPEQMRFLEELETRMGRMFNYKNGILTVKTNKGKAKEYSIKFEFNGERPTAIVSNKSAYIGIDPEVFFNSYLKNKSEQEIKKIIQVAFRHEVLHIETIRWIQDVLGVKAMDFLNKLGSGFSEEFSGYIARLYYTSLGINVESESGREKVRAMVKTPFFVAAEAARMLMEMELGGEFTEFSLAISDEERLRSLNRFRDAFAGQNPNTLRRINQYIEGMRSAMEDSMQVLTEGRGKVDITTATENAIKRLQEMEFEVPKAEVKTKAKVNNFSSMNLEYDEVIDRLTELQRLPDKSDGEYEEEDKLNARKRELEKMIFDHASKNPVWRGVALPETGEGGVVPDTTRDRRFTDDHDLVLSRRLSDYLNNKTTDFYGIDIKNDVLGLGPFISSSDLSDVLTREMLARVPGSTFTRDLFYSVLAGLNNPKVVFLQDLQNRLGLALDQITDDFIDRDAFIPLGQIFEEAVNPLMPTVEEVRQMDNNEGYYFVELPGKVPESSYAVSARQARSNVVFRVLGAGEVINYKGKPYRMGQEKFLLSEMKKDDPKGVVAFTSYVGNKIMFPEAPSTEGEAPKDRIRQSQAVKNTLARAWALLPGGQFKEQLASMIHYRQKSPQETIELARNYVNQNPLGKVTAEFLDGTLPFADLESQHMTGMILQSIYLRRIPKGNPDDQDYYNRIVRRTTAHYATSAGRIIQSYSAKGGGLGASVENPMVWLNSIYNQLEIAVRKTYEANDDEIDEIRKNLSKAQWKAVEEFFGKPETQGILGELMANQQKLDKQKQTLETLDIAISAALTKAGSRMQGLLDAAMGKITLPGGDIPEARKVKLDQDFLQGLAETMLDLAKELYPSIPNILDEKDTIKSFLLRLPQFQTGPQAAEATRILNMHFDAAYGVLRQLVEKEKARQLQEMEQQALSIEEKQQKLEELEGSAIGGTGVIIADDFPNWPGNIGEGEDLADEMEGARLEQAPSPVDTGKDSAEAIAEALLKSITVSMNRQPPGVKSALKQFKDEFFRQVKNRGKEEGLIPSFTPEKVGPVKKIRDLLNRIPFMEKVYNSALTQLKDTFDEDEIETVRQIIEAAKDRPFTLTSLSSVISKLDEVGGPRMSIQQLIRSSASTQLNFKQDLADVLLAETTLSADTRNRVVEYIYNGVSELIDKKRKETLLRLKEKYIKDATAEKKTRKVRSALQKLIEMTNLGILRDEEILSQIRQKIGLPELNEEQRKKLEDMVLKLDSFPEGFIRGVKESEILEYIKFVAPIAYGELLVSYQTANVLLGPGSHTINFQSAALGGLMDSLVFANHLRNAQIGNAPKSVSRALAAQAAADLKGSMFDPDGLAVQSALNIWKTGMFPADSNMVHQLGKVQIFEAMAREGEAARKGLRGDGPVEMTIQLPTLGDLVPGFVKKRNWYKNFSKTTGDGFGFASQWMTQFIPFYVEAKEAAGKFVRTEERDKGKVMIVNLRPAWMTRAQLIEIAKQPAMVWLDKKLGGKLIPAFGKFGNILVPTPSAVTPFVFSGRLMTAADSYNKTNIRKMFEIVEAGYLAVKNLELANEERKSKGLRPIEITEELVLREAARLLNRTPERVAAARRLAAKDAKRYNLSPAQEALRFDEILTAGRPTDEDMKALQERVILLARRATYQADFEGWVGLILEQFDRFGKSNWVAGSIFKFLRTSSNIVNSWLDYLPLVGDLRLKRGLGGMLAGSVYHRPPPVRGSVEYDLAVSKLWAARSLIGFFGTLLAAAFVEDKDNHFFNIHFRAPQEPIKRKAFFEGGGAPRSLQIGKFGRPWLFGLMKSPLFISWEALPPQMTGVFMPLAALGEVIRYQGRGAAESIAPALGASAISTAIGVMDLSMLQNMRGIMQVISPTQSPEKILQATAQLTGGVMASYIPYYPILRDVEMSVYAITGNPNSRIHKDGILTYFLGSVPFASQFGFPDLDFLGGNISPRLTNKLPIIRRYFRVGVSTEGYDGVENPSEQATHDKLMSLFGRFQKVINWDAGTLHDIAVQEYMMGVAMGKPSDISPYELRALSRDLTDFEKYEWVRRAGPLVQAELSRYIPRLDASKDSAEFQYIIDKTNVNKIKRAILRQILEERDQLNIMNSAMP